MVECEHEISAQKQERTYNRVPATRWRDPNQQEWARSLNQRMMRTGWYGHTQSSPRATSEGGCIQPRNPKLKVVVTIAGGGVERPQAVPLSRPSESTCEVEGVCDGGGNW